MAKAKLISIRVDAETHRRARELGLNISKVCDNALKEAVRRLEAPNPHTNGESGFLGEASLRKKVLGSPGEIRTLVSGSRARHA